MVELRYLGVALIGLGILFYIIGGAFCLDEVEGKLGNFPTASETRDFEKDVRQTQRAAQVGQWVMQLGEILVFAAIGLILYDAIDSVKPNPPPRSKAPTPVFKPTQQLPSPPVRKS